MVKIFQQQTLFLMRGFLASLPKGRPDIISDRLLWPWARFQWKQCRNILCVVEIKACHDGSPKIQLKYDNLLIIENVRLSSQYIDLPEGYQYHF